MAKPIETATNQELASIMQVISVGKDTRYDKRLSDKPYSIISKAEQVFLKTVLNEASKRLSGKN